MTHEEIKILMSAYLDSEAAPSQKNIVEEHLKTCVKCQKDLKAYQSLSSSLSKWPNEALSPDEDLKMQQRFEQRREPMLTLSSRNLMALGTTLALTVIIGSVMQRYAGHALQGRIHVASQYSHLGNGSGPIGGGETGVLKYAKDDLGNQYSAQQTQYMRYAASSNVPYVSNEKTNKQDQLYAAKPMAAASGLMMPVFRGAAIYAPAMRQAALARVMDKNIAPMAAAVPTSNLPDHKITRNAEITLKVENALRTQTELESLVSKYNGTISSSNIEKLEDGSRRGVMVLNVPPRDLDRLLPQLRSLGEVQLENQYASDVTNQYAYLQAQLDHNMTSRDNLRKLLKRNTQDIENNTYIQNQLNNVENTIDNLQSSMKTMDEQSFMAVITVNFYDTVTAPVPKPLTFKERMMDSLKNNFQSTMETAYNIAISSFGGIFIVATFLLQIVIWSLLFFGIYVIVRKFIKK